MNIVYSGIATKMSAVLNAEHLVHYNLPLEASAAIPINSLLGKSIEIKFTGRRFCSACGKSVKKFYGQGFCYPCFAESPENAECIVRPELCLAHEGKGRDPEWEEKHHNRPHYVYLSGTSSIKVGVTRATQIPTRWIDQGAEQGVLIADVPYRRAAGEIEVALKQFFADKTHWSKMLTTSFSGDILAERLRAIEAIPAEWRTYALPDSSIIHLHYPMLQTPTKVKSVSFEKTQGVAGTLIGIKAQYLLFHDGTVWNIRNHSGYEITISEL